jgi:hypothetical protein
MQAETEAQRQSMREEALAFEAHQEEAHTQTHCCCTLVTLLLHCCCTAMVRPFSHSFDAVHTGEGALGAGEKSHGGIQSRGMCSFVSSVLFHTFLLICCYNVVSDYVFTLL